VGEVVARGFGGEGRLDVEGLTRCGTSATTVVSCNERVHRARPSRPRAPFGRTRQGGIEAITGLIPLIGWLEKGAAAAAPKVIRQ